MSIAEFYFKIGDTLYIEFPSDEHYICALCDPVDRVQKPMRVHSEVRKHDVTDIHQEAYKAKSAQKAGVSSAAAVVKKPVEVFFQEYT